MFGFDPISVLVGIASVALPYVYRRWIRPRLPAWARDAIEFEGALRSAARVAFNAVEAIGEREGWSSIKKLDVYIDRIDSWAKSHGLPTDLYGYRQMARDYATIWAREMKLAERNLAEAYERILPVLEKYGIKPGGDS